MHFILQNLILSVLLFLGLITGGGPNAAFASVVQSHIIDDIHCDQRDYYSDYFPSNTNPLAELCDDLERLRSAQIATAVSSE